MEDFEIVELYWDRNQEAISATADKYGKYCSVIARNILGNEEDVKECVNDTYLSVWNSIPPQRPVYLSAFLGKITRNLALNIYKREHAHKRGGGQIAGVYEELAECVSGTDSVEQELCRQELVKAIDTFLETLSVKKRNIFICRYWYFESVSTIAKRFGMTENSVSVTLNRLRGRLQKYLTERGYEL